MVKRKNKLIALFAAMLMCLITLAALMDGGLTAYAESPVQGSDGVYSVPVNLDGLAMGADNFSSSATVEKSGENYYMTFGLGRITPIPCPPSGCRAVFPFRRISTP